MGPDNPLPLPADFSNVDDYVESLLKFSTSSWLLQTLNGGVHVLDFYTRSPDLYSTILPSNWRACFKDHDIMDILDLLMREDLDQFQSAANTEQSWRGGPYPPKDLLQYIQDVRKHLLGREFPLKNAKPNIARHVALGMNVKKVHEVGHFARYVDQLTSEVAASGRKEISHLIDFGSGQNYLGRALAAPPYSKHLVAVESKQHNIEGAKDMDIKARLVSKPVVFRNKKEYRAKSGKGKNKKGRSNEECAHTSPSALEDSLAESRQDPPTESATPQSPRSEPADKDLARSASCTVDGCPPSANDQDREGQTTTTHFQVYSEGHGSVQYVEHIIRDGDLTPVIDQVLDDSRVEGNTATSTSNTIEEPTSLKDVPKSVDVNAMVMSLHSCGNLVHHGLRSLLLNPSVAAVAMVGCCYNLMTERLGPPTYKLPTLRPNHPRLASTSNAFDPHGFPMSKKLADYPLQHIPISSAETSSDQPKGVRLNITARMMAVQAPFNWGAKDSKLFFARHFYRALLQRIFLDRGVVSAPVDDDDVVVNGVSASGHTSKVNWTPRNGRGPGLSSDGTCTPLTIGTLRKFAYSDFLTYVRAAVAKLTAPNTFCEIDPKFISEKMEGLSDEEIRGYEEEYKEKQHELSVMWSLMAFSAGVVEAVVVTDRWLWLKEQPEVEHAWVEPVFDYALSPRNLVVVGVKR